MMLPWHTFTGIKKPMATVQEQYRYAEQHGLLVPGSDPITTGLSDAPMVPTFAQEVNAASSPGGAFLSQMGPFLLIGGAVVAGIFLLRK